MYIVIIQGFSYRKVRILPHGNLPIIQLVSKTRPVPSIPTSSSAEGSGLVLEITIHLGSYQL